tara:strand:- start:2166 stop:4121 length:1956 start_codon:yes stop_codon:yes gene_type:complete
MPSTVYKGDLAEVTLGHESGIYLQSANSAGHASGFPQTFTWTSAAGTGNTSDITFAGGIANSPVQSTKLQMPEGMLVGSKITFHASGNHANDDYTTTGQIYHVVGFTNASGATVITVSPQMNSAAASITGDAMYIHTYGTPTIDEGMTHNTDADASDETILADQFVGLAATVTLPDIKNEILRQHVVGIGRDVVVQVAGKQTMEGGSIELMMNNPRWLYYCLGAESVKEIGASGVIANPTLGAAATAGDSHLTLSALSSIVVGDYLLIEDGSVFEAMPSDITASQAGANTWPDGAGPYKFHERSEIRRVAALNGSNSSASKVVWLDDPLNFNHANGLTCRLIRFDAASSNKSPDVAQATGTITNPTTRLLYSNWHLPSFCLETSIRSRNIGAHSQETGAAIGHVGTASDANTLTRVFRGCKVKDWSLTADADAAVKFSLNFDAALSYTDTGRKDASGGAGTEGDRYTAHRMFENTADSTVNRKVAGIAPYTQKPYLFYNGSIKAFGQTIARVTKFNLSGNNNTQFIHTVQGSDITMNSTTDQVPFAGTRLPSLAVEGKNEYDLTMEVIINDALLWDELRFATERDYTAPIELTLIKQGSGGTREEIKFTIEDYLVESAPIPIPEDKGVIRTEVSIKPKHVYVRSVDTLFHC